MATLVFANHLGEGVHQTSRTAVTDAAARVVREAWCSTLRRSDVAPTDSFFALGGDSLLAARVVAEVGRRLGIDVRLNDLFEARTLAAFEEHVLAAHRLRQPANPLPERLDRSAPLRPSLAQERYCILHTDPRLPQFRPALMHAAFRIRGPLDTARFDAALRLVLDRHEILRTGFRVANGRVQQRIAGSPLLKADVIQASRPGERTDEEVRRLIRRSLRQGFDRAAPPLMRVQLIEITDDDRVLLLVMDHIIGDGWSLAVLLRDLGVAYTQLASDASYTLPRLEYQFADWAAWQRSLLNDERLASLDRHWRSTLAGGPETLATPLPGYTEVAQADGVAVTACVSGARATRWRRFGGRHRTTLYGLILCGLLRVLADDVGPGRRWVMTSVANRGPAWTESMVGALSHTTFLGVDVPSDDGSSGLLDRVNAAISHLDTHNVLPNSLLRERLWPADYPELARIPMVYFVVNPAWTGGFALSGTSVVEFPVWTHEPMRGLEYWVTDHGDDITFALWFRAGSLDPAYVSALLARSLDEVDRETATQKNAG